MGRFLKTRSQPQLSKSTGGLTGLQPKTRASFTTALCTGCLLENELRPLRSILLLMKAARLFKFGIIFLFVALHIGEVTIGDCQLPVGKEKGGLKQRPVKRAKIQKRGTIEYLSRKSVCRYI